jgi:hypothetical protein
MSYANPEYIVCEQCGSKDVSVDAILTWDIKKQDWNVAVVLDGMYCEECNNGIRGLWKPLLLKDIAKRTINKEEKDGISK